jgi:hypothetical protein
MAFVVCLGLQWLDHGMLLQPVSIAFNTTILLTVDAAVASVLWWLLLWEDALQWAATAVIQP